MKSLSCWMSVGLVALLAGAPAHADLKVATSLTDLASVAQFVGGKHVTAQSLCNGYEDPHFVPAKPSLMKSIQHADVFVSTGLELDGTYSAKAFSAACSLASQHGDCTLFWLTFDGRIA